MKSYSNKMPLKGVAIMVAMFMSAACAGDIPAAESRLAETLAKLTEWWGDPMMPGYMPEQSAKRLILFAPNSGAWSYISSNWDNVLHLPSRAGDHLRDVDYQTILGSIAQTIA